MRSRATIGQARDRVQKIAKRDDLYTNDPLMAEIMLAQVTSNIALVEAVQELSEDIRNLDESILYVGQKARGEMPLSDQRSEEEKKKVEKQQATVNEMLRNINRTLDSILQFLKTVSRKL